MLSEKFTFFFVVDWKKISVNFRYADFSDEQKLQISRFFYQSLESKMTYYYI